MRRCLPGHGLLSTASRGPAPPARAVRAHTGQDAMGPQMELALVLGTAQDMPAPRTAFPLAPGWSKPGLTPRVTWPPPLHPLPPTKPPETKAVGRNVAALARRAQAALGSHPGFTAGVLVPASRGEELSAFQVCTKLSNLSSHGGVIKAVPTKQNELNRFPRPGESVLGSGKILFPLCAGAGAVSDVLSPAWPSVGQCHTLLLRLTGGWKVGECHGRGLHHAGVLGSAEHCCSPRWLISLHSGEKRQAALTLERSSVPGDRQAFPPPPDIFSLQIVSLQ